MAIDDRVRVTHGERESAAEELRVAYAVGCLDDDELEERVSRAYAAKTRGQLTSLVYDLPLILLWLTVLRLRSRLPQWGRQLAAAVLITRPFCHDKQPRPG